MEILDLHLVFHRLPGLVFFITKMEQVVCEERLLVMCQLQITHRAQLSNWTTFWRLRFAILQLQLFQKDVVSRFFVGTLRHLYLALILRGILPILRDAIVFNSLHVFSELIRLRSVRARLTGNVLAALADHLFEHVRVVSKLESLNFHQLGEVASALQFECLLRWHVVGVRASFLLLIVDSLDVLLHWSFARGLDVFFTSTFVAFKLDKAKEGPANLIDSCLVH